MKNHYENQIDIELTGDNLDEYNAHQEAELASAMHDEEILVNDAQLKKLLQELWTEEAELAIVREEIYTEREAFDDFYANQQEEWN